MALNCSQVMSSMICTGDLRGALEISRSRRACRVSSIGTNSARVFSVLAGSMPLSLATISRKFGRLEASTTPLRSTIRPRGGGVRRKLN